MWTWSRSQPGVVYGSQIFKLKSVIQKAWATLEEANAEICQRDTGFVLAHKPVFDNQKLTMTRIDTFVENDIQCGTLLAIKQRQPFDGDFALNADTPFPEWNQTATNINKLLGEINATIRAEVKIQQIKAGGAQAHRHTQSSSDCADFVCGRSMKRMLFWVLVVFAIVGFISTSYIIGKELHVDSTDDTDQPDTSSKPTGQLISINIQVGSQQYPLDVEVDSNILDLKRLIFAKENIPVKQQSVIFKNEVLDDYKNLEYYGVERGNSIVISVLLPGKLTIYIRSKDRLGHRSEYSVYASDSVASLKDKLEKDTGIGPAQQRLYHNDVEMENDSQSLTGYKITDKSTVTLLTGETTKRRSKRKNMKKKKQPGV
jgi:hypothetical protein